jgi:hypothetical protein
MPLAGLPPKNARCYGDSDLLEPSPFHLNWLYELQQMNRRDARRTGRAEAAVDGLLATYW